MERFSEVPFRYRLGVGDDGKMITLHTTTSGLEFVQSTFSRKDIPLTQVIVPLQKELGLPDFISPDREKWGYGGVLHKTSGRNDLVGWECPLPKGGGLNPEHETRFYAVAASLGSLVNCLEVYPGENFSSQQLIHQVTMVSEKRLHGASMSLYVTPKVLSWVGQQPDKSRDQEIEGVMKSSYEYMSGEDNIYPDYDYRVRFQKPRWISFHVPGDACDLSPARRYDRESPYGCLLVTHNCDHPIQQLTFLVGLGAICDKIYR